MSKEATGQANAASPIRPGRSDLLALYSGGMGETISVYVAFEDQTIPQWIVKEFDGSVAEAPRPRHGDVRTHYRLIHVHPVVNWAFFAPE